MSCISESLQHPQTRFAAVRHWPTRSHEWDNVRGLTGSSPIVSCAKECLGASDLGIYEWDRVEIVCCQLQTPCFSENKNPKKLIQNTLKCCLRHATNVRFSCFFAPDAAFENRALRDFFTTPKECPIIPRFLPESLPPTSRCCRLLSSDDDAAASSDINVDFLSILLAPGFQLVSIQPQLCGYMLVPFDPVGQHMIRQRILFKWLTYGWCLGKISA